MSAVKKQSCRLCAGSGQMVVMRSWFHADGYRRIRCGICHGSGESSYRPGAEWVRSQSALRAKAVRS
ncbi:hypothetical protein [Bosea vaviloviae]|uniref:hypothetical protein n=1 Tax=Bosea vaviloviae TaxID=1526658 RepID=UPI000A5615FB|nr:hypothetical protein [Bosea vaviloviae]